MPNLQVEYKGWKYNSHVSWIEVNHHVVPLSDERVRQAMSIALDRTFIAGKLWSGVGKPAMGGLASSNRFSAPAVQLPPRDPLKVAKLLDETGLKPNVQPAQTRPAVF